MPEYEPSIFWACKTADNQLKLSLTQWAVMLISDSLVRLVLQISVVRLMNGTSFINSANFVLISCLIRGITFSVKYFLLGTLYLYSSVFQ